MTPDLDIWRAANLLIRQHREDAEVVASRRADELLERGDWEGAIGLASHPAGNRRVSGNAHRKAELAITGQRTTQSIGDTTQSQRLRG